MNDMIPNKLQLHGRSKKPRSKGLTSIIDYGPDSLGWTGERGVADLLDCASEYIDFAKIYALNALLIPSSKVKSIVGLYQDAAITCYSGGILFEHAYRRGQVAELLTLLASLGFKALEISENYIELTDDERQKYFDQCEKSGFTVIYEFGRKNPQSAISLYELSRLVNNAIESGVAHIIVEQSEILMTAREDPSILKAMTQEKWFDRILIEADAFQFPQQHVGLLKDFGKDVSLANIAPGQALRLEGLRQGVGRAVDYSMFHSDD